MPRRKKAVWVEEDWDKEIEEWEEEKKKQTLIKRTMAKINGGN